MSSILSSTRTENRSQDASINLINYKCEEKQWSESLYRNLHAMKRIYQPTPQFLEVLDKNMFIKTNSNGFFHVIHFIFTCLDLVEFNKRFKWPILDKTYESEFRNATVDYMNHLNNTHQLGFEKLKLHHIHIPGGLKFIKLIHKFSILIMEEELKKETGPIPNENEMLDTEVALSILEEKIERGMDFVQRLETQTDILRTKNKEINAMLKSFFTNLQLSENQCWSCLSIDWKKSFLIAEEHVKAEVKQLILLNQKCIDFVKFLPTVFTYENSHFIQFDKEKLAIALNNLKKLYPQYESGTIVESNSINVNELFRLLEHLLPSIMEKITKFDSYDDQGLEHELNEIEKFHNEVSILEKNFKKFSADLEPSRQKQEERFREYCANNPNPTIESSRFNLIQTPRIVRRVQERTDPLRRISLMGSPKNITLSLPADVKTKRTNLNISNYSVLSTTSTESRARKDALDILFKKPKSRNQTQVSEKSLFINRCSTPMLSSTDTGRQHNLRFESMWNLPAHSITQNIIETTALSPNAITVTRKTSTNAVYHFKTSSDITSSVQHSPTGRLTSILDVSNHLPATIMANQDNENNSEDLMNITDGLLNVIIDD